MWKEVLPVLLLVYCNAHSLNNDNIKQALKPRNDNNSTEHNKTNAYEDLSKTIEKLHDKVSNVIPENGSLQINTVKGNNIEFNKSDNNTNNYIATTAKAEITNLTELALNNTDIPVTFIQVALPNGLGNTSLVLQVPINLNIKDIADTNKIEKEDLKENKIESIKYRPEDDESLKSEFFLRLRSKYQIYQDLGAKKPYSNNANMKTEKERVGQESTIKQILNKLDKIVNLLSKILQANDNQNSEYNFAKLPPSFDSPNYINRFDLYSNDDFNLKGKSPFINEDLNWNEEDLKIAKKYSDEQIAKTMKDRIKKIRQEKKLIRYTLRPEQMAFVEEVTKSKNC